MSHYPGFKFNSGNFNLLFTYDHGKQARDETHYPFKFFIFLNYTLKRYFQWMGRIIDSLRILDENLELNVLSHRKSFVCKDEPFSD